MQPQKKYNKTIFLATKNISIDFMKAYQDQDVDKMLSFCAPDCEVSFKPLGENGIGPAFSFGKTMWNSLIGCFPSLDNTVHHVIDENGNARCEVTIWGKQAKDFAGIISKSNEFEEDHIFIFKTNENEKLCHIEIDWNHESFVHQLSK